MIRILGFLTGSVAMTGIILAVIGLPELRPAELVAAPTAASEIGPAESPPTMLAATEPPEPVEATPLPTTTDDVVRSRNPIDEPQLIRDPGPDPDPTVAGVEPHWHSFWNPFRSEIAANGFAARLRAVTGIDYRVVRLEPGSYQVAFAYGDDGERRSKIAQIETATGLSLPEESR